MCRQRKGRCGSGLGIALVDSSGGSGNLRISGSAATSLGIAVDAARNIYVGGVGTDNAFKITPAGGITEIIDATGDGMGNLLDEVQGLAAEADGDVYVTGEDTNNAFRITAAGVTGRHPLLVILNGRPGRALVARPPVRPAKRTASPQNLLREGVERQR